MSTKQAQSKLKANYIKVPTFTKFYVRGFSLLILRVMWLHGHLSEPNV